MYMPHNLKLLYYSKYKYKENTISIKLVSYILQIKLSNYVVFC